MPCAPAKPCASSTTTIPLPLLDQLVQRYGQAVEITYRQREPGNIVIDFVKKQ
jgi:hypothetical protein